MLGSHVEFARGLAGLHDLPQKKKLHDLTVFLLRAFTTKKKITRLTAKKKLHDLPQKKKLHDVTIFLYARLPQK